VRDSLTVRCGRADGRTRGWTDSRGNGNLRHIATPDQRRTVARRMQQIPRFLLRRTLVAWSASRPSGLGKTLVLAHPARPSSRPRTAPTRSNRLLPGAALEAVL